MLFVSAIEQLGFIMYEFYKYGKDGLNKCMKKSAKYIARLSHALELSRNQDYLQSLTETEEGISREDFLKIGDYNRIVYYYKKIPGMEGYITPPGSPFPPAPTPRIPGTPGKPGTPKPPGTPEPPGKPKPPRTPETPHFQPLP